MAKHVAIDVIFDSSTLCFKTMNSVDRELRDSHRFGECHRQLDRMRMMPGMFAGTGAGGKNALQFVDDAIEGGFRPHTDGMGNMIRSPTFRGSACEKMRRPGMRLFKPQVDPNQQGARMGVPEQFDGFLVDARGEIRVRRKTFSGEDDVGT